MIKIITVGSIKEKYLKDAIEEYGRDYEDVFSYEYGECEYEILTVKVDDKVVVSIEGYDG